MSWFQSLRDDFTLKPFETLQTHSDSADMASGPPDVMEPAEVGEECSGKKKSKFQTFKKFFARKKRKEPSSSGADAELKASQSSDNVSKTSENNTLTRAEKDKGSGSKISLGSKALSHDSVFVSDSSEANEALGASQDSIHGKVKSLQLQLKQAIKIGSPPSLMCVKKAEDAGTMSEDDGLPCSPPEYTTHHTVQNQAQRNSSISLEVTDSDEDQLSCTASSRAVSPLVVIPGDFSQPASPFGCLDNSAAKHKMGLRHKACNKRKPVHRLGVKAEEDPVVKEILNTSFPDSPEEKEEQDKEDAGEDELKLKVEREEEDEEEEKEQPQHSKETVLRDKEEWEEGEDESEAEQDVSQGLDASFPPEQCLSEEEAADAQPSSKRASSLESPRATPEPPADHREYLLDTPDVETEEKRNDENPTLGGEEEEEVDEPGEEGGSFLQEVLSSLKTPLPSSSLGAETEAVLEIEEEEEEKGEADIEEGEEVKEEDAEEEEPVSYQAAPSGSLLLSQTANEEEEEAATLSVSAPPCQDFEEEDKDQEKVEEDEVEELEVEQFSQHSEDEGKKEEAEEVQPRDENDLLQRKTDLQVEEEEEDQSEGEEEAIELEKEPKVEEEGWEKKEEDDVEVEVEVKTEKERVEEAEEAEEEEEEEEEESDDAEEAVEIFPDAASGEVHSVTSAQEADEGVDVAVGDETVCIAQCTDDNDDIPTDQADQESATVHESQTASNQNSEDEMSDGEEGMEEAVEIEHKEPKSDQEEDMEANQADVEPDLEKESVEVSIFKQKDQTEVSQSATVSSKPTSLCLQESNFEAQSEESKTSPATTTIHINLYSPSSEKGTFSFKQSPTAADPEISESPSDAGEATEQITAPTDEESADKVEEEEKEEQHGKRKEDATPHVSAEETEERSSGSDQSKVRFTINSAWQRSLSIEDSGTPPLTPPACVSSSSSIAAGSEGVDVASTAKKDPQADAEPESSAKPELVLSPSRARNAGITIAKPQSNASQTPAKPPAPAATTTEENPVVLEGNPDNPFGVRLRKTVALHRFSSEEENSEPPIEPPAQPTSCKVESTPPISAKPSISQPISNKPALPKKPEVHGDSGVKTKRVSDPPPVRGVSGGSNSPSWITVAKQKQRIYKENSLEEITVKKEEQERKSSLPMYVSSAASREQSHKTSESTGKVSSLETSKSSVSVEKETRRALSPPTPVPPQPPKSQSLPCPVPPKPQPPPASAKPTPQPTPAQRSLSPPTPVPVPQKPLSCTSPPLLSKPAPSSKPVQAQSTTVTSPPFSSRTASPQSGSKAPALSGQTPSTQRSLPSSDSPQDEPPWMALAKKKAKAWSEMPQIVQ